jgi:hypothetical protein
MKIEPFRLERYFARNGFVAVDAFFGVPVGLDQPRLTQL